MSHTIFSLTRNSLRGLVYRSRPCVWRRSACRTQVTLASNGCLSLRGQRFEVRCRSGALWITQSGDNHDYIVKAGESWTACTTASVVVQALHDSQFTVRF